MKRLKIRRILSVAVSICLIAETFSWSSVDVSAAEIVAEEQDGLSEDSESEILTGGSDTDTGTQEERPMEPEEAEKEEQPGDGKGNEEPGIPEDGKEEEIPGTPEEGEREELPKDPEEEKKDEEAGGFEDGNKNEESADSEGGEKESGSEDSKDNTGEIISDGTESDEKTEEVLDEPEALPETEVSVLSGTSQETCATPGNFANVILFVDFQDTDHSGHLSSSMGQCFLGDAEYTFDLFNGSSQSPRGMRQFVSNISYGALEVANIFPQYEEENGKIIPYQLKNNEEYYYNNDSAIIQEAVQQMRESGQLSADLDLDRNVDGMVDNLTIVVPCQKDGGSDRFYGHKAHFAGDERVNGKRVGAYNVIPESTAYLGMNSYGVVIHEFLHTIGYPDLYRKSAGMSAGYPVERWDIMASTSWFVQYPLAYLRGIATGWFDIPEVDHSIQGMSLYAASTASYENRDQQAVILKTEYSDTEFFVLEYRKQGTAYSSTDYDCKIPGSGLIIYRVNLSSDTNITGDGDMIYVFRPGDSYDDDHLELAAGNMNESFLSAESGRTSYGTHDLDKSLSDGAITFSDGTNSGIVISNVGSAKGDQITFDITYAEIAEEDYWQNVSVQKDDTSFEIASCMDADGTLYYLQRKNNAASGPVYLYTCRSGEWKRCGSALPGGGYWYHLEKYNGSIYSGYIENGKVKLARWSGSKWETVFTSLENAGELDMTADADGICLAYTDSDSRKLYACRYSGTTVQSMGAQVAVANDVPGSRWPNTISNPSVTVGNGKTAVMYREVLNDNRIYVRLYEEADHTWKEVGGRPLSANGGMIRIHRNRLYLLKNGGRTYEDNECDLYVYDLSRQDGEWSKVVDAFYANESIADMSLTFQGDTPYIAYLGGASQNVYVMTPERGQWVSLGGKVAGEIISGLKTYLYDGKIYITWLSTVNNRVYIKSHNAGHCYEAAVTREATCGAEGTVTYTCVDCQDTYTEIIPKLTHQYGQWSTTVPSTCQKEGKKTRKCAVCGKTESAVVAKKAHTPGAAATCTKAQTCKVCKTVLKKATGHRHMRTEKTAATFLKTGLTKTVCKDCGAVTAKKTLARISCKKGQTYTVGNYKYKIISPRTNGTGTVSFEGLAKNVSSVKIGDTVTILGARFKIIQVSDKALKNKTGVTSVTIGSYVQTIGKEAFYGMKKLKTLTIKSTKVTKVGSNALKNIHASAWIKVPRSKLNKYKSLLKNKGQKTSVKITY